MTYPILAYIFFLHWIADFVLQSDRIAQNKSKDNAILVYHCAIYFVVFFLGLTFWNFAFSVPYDYTRLLQFALFNAIAHFSVDYITSRITSRLYAKGNIHNFFVVIGFDQMLHMIILVVSFQLMVL